MNYYSGLLRALFFWKEYMNWPTIDGFTIDSLPKSIQGLRAGDQNWSDQGEGRHAAVCLLLIPGADGAAHVVLTKRSTTVGTHKGQIGFAGGRVDDEDKTVYTTALRELSEELGVEGPKIFAHGVLEPIKSLRFQSMIYPVLVTADVSIDDFSPSADEVDKIYSFEWTKFSLAKSESFSFNLFGKWRYSQVFKLPDCTVWGLTAAMLKQADLK
jgi:8-oxo-dGTP pyrophosphatase MutT (NUDIX family)